MAQYTGERLVNGGSRYALVILNQKINKTSKKINKEEINKKA